MNRHYFPVFADYFAFALLDEGTAPPDNLWNEQALSDRVAVAKGTVVVGTVRNMFVPVIIETLGPQEIDDASALDTWDHVVECSLEISSGSLVVFGTTGYYPEAPRLRLPSTTYRTKIYYGGLSTLSKDGLNGNDIYFVILQPGPPIEPRVVKQWEYSGSR